MTLVNNPHLANEIPANPHLSRMTLVLPTSPEVTLIWPKARQASEHKDVSTSQYNQLLRPLLLDHLAQILTLR